MSVNAKVMKAAATAGRAAARAGRPVIDCPYSPNGDATDKALALVWVRNYLRMKPPAKDAVSYDG